MNIGYKQQRKYFMIISIANFRRRMRFLNKFFFFEIFKQITRGKMIEQLTIFVKFSAKAICHTKLKFILHLPLERFWRNS